MDVEEKDQRLNELRQALANLPEPTTPKLDNQLFDFTKFDISSIPALTTLDLSQLTATSIPHANTAGSGTGIGSLNSGSATVYTLGGGGGGGGTGAAGITYHSPNVWSTTGTHTSWTNPGRVQISADDVILGDKSLVKILDTIEQRLGILNCDHELEKEWEDLCELGIRYRQLKQNIDEKLKTFNTLKQQTPGVAK